jgi:predicted metal-binding membrane protein
MSTGTAHVPDAAHPDDRHAARPHVDDADRATTRLVIVSIVATLSVAWTLVLVYAFTAEEGMTMSTGTSLLVTLVVSIVPGLLAAWAVHLVSATSDGTPTPYVVLAPICIVLMMCGVALMAEFGARAHDGPAAPRPVTVVAQRI